MNQQKRKPNKKRTEQLNMDSYLRNRTQFDFVDEIAQNEAISQARNELFF